MAAEFQAKMREAANHDSEKGRRLRPAAAAIASN